ncbi:hypothetical protein GIB67_042091 [Kingdonia uniflora]|uniref:START domain-containing protein n=1 Tax=Kingdonia uniflora TaxID=39325 RepID=A0A7J7MW55_9MAGN|nr:hypothetical protein GIB67_042091 [Kingdonia uniflora]
MEQNHRTKPNILVTSTPGTGKTTMSSLLADTAQLRHINVIDVVKEKNLYDGWDENLECHFINEDLSTSQYTIRESGNRIEPFYALLEASHFTAHWLPFCKIFNMKPRTPEVHFAEKFKPPNDHQWLPMKKLYEEMKQRIEAEVKRGTISEELRKSHKRFSEWSSRVRKAEESKRNSMEIRFSQTPADVPLQINNKANSSKVCERSLSIHGTGPNASSSSQFIRSEMLPSDYLIRPCVGGGSIIHIVDILDLELRSYNLRYQSSEVEAQKLTIAISIVSHQPSSSGDERGFNDVVNGYNDDGWSLINCDGAEDVITTINFKNMSTGVNPTNLIPFPGGVLCVKASMLLQACELGKNLALMVYVAVGSVANPILEFLEEWSTENFEEISSADIDQAIKFFVNGCGVGIHRSPGLLVKTLR